MTYRTILQVITNKQINILTSSIFHSATKGGDIRGRVRQQRRANFQATSRGLEDRGPSTDVKI